MAYLFTSHEKSAIFIALKVLKILFFLNILPFEIKHQPLAFENSSEIVTKHKRLLFDQT